MANKIRDAPLAFDYFYGMEADQFSFFRIPKCLFTEPEMERVSTEAKLVYGVLLDRMQLSVQNRWLDKNNRVYIIYPVDELMAMLKFSRQKITKYMAELDEKTGVGLIEKKRLGQGKANIIYVKNFIPYERRRQQDDVMKKQNLQKFQYGISKDSDTELLEVPIWNGNNTEYSDTEKNNNPSIRNELADEELIDRMRRVIQENIEYNNLIERSDQASVDEIVELMLEVLCDQGSRIKIGQREYSLALVQGQIMKLKFSHVLYVLDCLRTTTAKIHNIKSYLLTTLFNASKTMSHYYQQQVNHELYGEP
ncbi:hypothetical protein M2454_000209 [Aequitasia blattaphilus]|uniref:Replication initiator protein A n=2 Tax=Lachnospiraceae TaxID=186803 RepID=A0ABT1EFW1_9FIRM|nr:MULTISPECIES: replication initiator protein A [Lachnospiraceae]MCP1100990.1 replication initiator protein A [Aequitasia blattaphilus]MCP1109583.1 replication initiator protein A [Ohessyouella blattaphilus]MCR8562977.1 replication initiator protein A [Ohessyouella blattaphilus]MCR8613630.1 replication initiator protein A [Aequitasia blattaphilus]